PFGAGPVGLTHSRFKSPVLRKGAERSVPTDPLAFTGATHGASPVIQMLVGMAAEMLERPLMRFQEGTELFVGRAPVEAATAESQRQHKNVHRARSAPKLYARLSPVDLALQAGRGLKPRLCRLRSQLQSSQRGHEALHHIIATGEAAF